VNDTRQLRLLKRIATRMSGETAEMETLLRAREDYQPAYDSFLQLARNLADPLQPPVSGDSGGRKPLGLFCVQAPLELVHAAGFQPFRIFCGSYAAGNLASGNLPALICPLIRSIMGMLLGRNRADGHRNGNPNPPLVLPTTCDWVVGLPQIMDLSGLPQVEEIHWLEMPHFRETTKSRQRWLQEVHSLKEFLEKISGQKITRANLAASIALYQRAFALVTTLSSLRSEGRLASVWFFLLLNTLLAAPLEEWLENVEKLIAQLPPKEDERPRVFLAGSPIFFPNFKLPLLMEEAGLFLAGDDICSAERFLPGRIAVSDPSMAGMLEALAQHYHQGCLCPVFADNERRVHNILGQRHQKKISGVVFIVLKGCHPYDLESYTLEKQLKDEGLSFLRLESDYSAEDNRNLLTRLEAFRHTLR
jgi:benzoyl-CoA reductase/2-hydroxyglutaryl-CoA dehydratase subunit BcrC/BadD/HgdB